MRSPAPLRRLLLALIAVQTLTCGASESEVQCEETVSMLARCCPNFSASRISCEQTEGCDAIFPQLSVAESQCIQSKDCETAISTGICSRVLQHAPQVCP